MTIQLNLRFAGFALTGFLIPLLGCPQAGTSTAPLVNGKTLQEWAEQAAAPLQPNDWADGHHRYLRAEEERRQALENIRAFGAAAIPVLMELSQHGDRRLSADAGGILSGIGKQISPEAEAVIPLLVSLRNHTTSAPTTQWSDRVLRDISTGTPPVSAMMNPLSDRTLRSAVVVELAKSDWWINGMSVSKKPLDALRDIAYSSAPKSSPDPAYADAAKLHDQVSGTRLYVIDNFELKHLPSVDALIQQAKHPQSIMYALQGLQHYAQAGAAVPDLDLGSLTLDLSGAVKVLIQIVEEGHRGHATRAMKILGLIGPEAKSAVPLALELLKSDYYDAQAEAAAALGGFGVGDRKVVQALVDSAEKKQMAGDRRVRPQRSGSRQGLMVRSQLPPGTLRANVAVSLGKLASHPDLSIPTLVKMLDLNYMGSSEHCDLAATALAEFGPEAQVAIDELVDKPQSKPLPNRR